RPDNAGAGGLALLQRDVARGPRPHSEQCAATAAEPTSAAATPSATAAKSAPAADADVQPLVVRHRRGGALTPADAQLPQELPGARVVRAHFRPPARHHPRPLRVLPYKGREKVRPLAARPPPQLVAGLLVESHQERLLLIIDLQEEAVAFEHGR